MLEANLWKYFLKFGFLFNQDPRQILEGDETGVRPENNKRDYSQNLSKNLAVYSQRIVTVVQFDRL